MEESTTNIEEMNWKLSSAVIQTAEGNIPKSKGKKQGKSVPWWDDNCSKVIKMRNRTFRQLKNHHTIETLIQYKKAQAVVRKTIRSAKRTYWRQYCNKIGRETQLADVWGMIRRMNGLKRNFEIPVLHSNNMIAISCLEKAELLAETFVQIHSSENLTVKAKQCRGNILAKNAGITKRRAPSGEDLDLPFTLFELRRAISNARQTSPGKDGICYSMLAHMTDRALEAVLRLFNEIWDTGKLPSKWKESVIVPILKPGKDASNPSSYRPIALTSQLGKTMERMVMERLIYFLESKNLVSNYQSGFRKGRGTMDNVLCLESDIRKAQTNREMVIAVFFDIEKAYDMLWKEGLLIKLNKLGVYGKMYNWILDFMFGRTIEVKVGAEYSKVYQVENGTPQGSVCSPTLFNIMINDIFGKVEQNVGKSLYADDGALWVRGRNLNYIQKKLQEAIEKVEQWADEWGFKFSIAKTQMICFSKQHKEISLKLYGQVIEQVKVIRLLGMWFDEKLTWKQHIEKVRDKCKKINNLLRCLSGRDWGATRASLFNIYQAMMRAALDYGCIGYVSAAASHLKKLDVQQAQGLRICSGAFKSSPISAIQVEMGGQPLSIRRLQLMLAYWVNLQGHSTSHPTKTVLEGCWEHQETNYMSFGWVGNIKAEQAGLHCIQFSPTISYSQTPPWLFVKATVNFDLKQQLKKGSRQAVAGGIAQRYLEQHLTDKTIVFTDGSKDPDTGRTGAAVFIPHYKVHIKKRTTDHLSVYAVELTAIILALEWTEKNNHNNIVIASDSQAALISINTLKSCRQDLVLEIHNALYRMHRRGLKVSFIWVPAHVGLEGNEVVDILAKQSLKSQTIDREIPLSRAEGKALIKKHVGKVWQEYWDIEDTGRHLYNIQTQVGLGRRMGRSRREEAIITRLRIGHTGLNDTLHRIGRHTDGKCGHCGEKESVRHVLLECGAYEEERRALAAAGKRAKMVINIKNLLGRELISHVIKYLKSTRLIHRI